MDLSDASNVSRLVSEVRPDFVFHLASHVAGSRSRDLVLPTFRDNLASTVNLLLAAAETSCRRFVLTGSLEEPDSPSDPPSSPYAAAKTAARLYADLFHALYSVPVVKARLFMVYGPAQRDERKLVPYVIRCLLAGEPPRLSPGQRPVDWIYVDDVVDGLIAMACAPKAIEGKRLDLGSGSLVTVRCVVERLVALIGAAVTPDFGALPDRALEQVRKADTDSTREQTGWMPAVPLDEGLRRTVEWCRTHPA
jgi:nucleoside-diphosphate-sugar epimerase